MKYFHAYDKHIGGTFGMEVDPSSKAYKLMKKNIVWKTKRELHPGYKFRWEGEQDKKVKCVPAVYVAAIMREAHWLVTEKKAFDWFYIDGERGEDIGSFQAPIHIDYNSINADTAIDISLAIFEGDVPEEVYPESDYQDPHGKIVGHRFDPYHDVTIYEDGYEERFYIGE